MGEHFFTKCLPKGWFFLKLRLFNAKVKPKRRNGKPQKQNEGHGIAVKAALQAAACGCDKRCTNKVAVHNAEIRCKMLLTVERRGKRRYHCGAGTVG